MLISYGVCVKIQSNLPKWPQIFPNFGAVRTVKNTCVYANDRYHGLCFLTVLFGEKLIVTKTASIHMSELISNIINYLSESCLK